MDNTNPMFHGETSDLSDGGVLLPLTREELHFIHHLLAQHEAISNHDLLRAIVCTEVVQGNPIDNDRDLFDQLIEKMNKMITSVFPYPEET